ncbi:MAG: FG-GAP repeat protein [Polyangiaceae bacterium]
MSRVRTAHVGLGVVAALWAASLAPRAQASTSGSGSGALDAVSRGAAAALSRLPPHALIVAGPLTTDQPAPKGDELALRIAAIIAGRLAGGAQAHGQTAPLGPALAIARRSSVLVFVQVALAVGDLRVTLDVYPIADNVWDRVRHPSPAPTIHGFASAHVDAEVRSFLGPLLLEQTHLDRAKHDEGDVLAVGCGDVDGDGGNEIVLVTRSRVSLGRLRAGVFLVERAAPWATLAVRAPVAMRSPLASAVVVEGAVEVGSTDRGSVALGPDLGLSAAIAGLPAWGGSSVVCLAAEPAAGAFDGAPVDCAMSRDPKPVLSVPAPRFDTFAAADVAGIDGRELPIVAVREPNGTLRIKLGESVVVPAGAFGAQLAVGDFDEDGVPDVAATANGEDDAIRIYSVDPGATDLRLRVEFPAPDGVRALGICPPEANGEPALVAVVGDEIWLMRAAPSLTGASALPSPASPLPSTAPPSKPSAPARLP